MGIERRTAVIGLDATVARVFRRVKPDQHAAEVLAAPRSLGLAFPS